MELELVHGVVDGLLLGDEPFVDLEDADVRVLRVRLRRVQVVKVVLELAD